MRARAQQNDLDEFYSMIAFACPTLFGNVSASAFRKLYTVPVRASVRVRAR